MMIRATARTVRLGVFRARPAGRRGGFSLTELLIAIGVLGIGMGMVAALFVTGLIQVRLSLGTSEGGMVAANGISVAKMFLTAGDVTTDELAVVADGANTTLIGAAFQKCPYDDATTAKGFVILARQCGSGAYQLVSVAYAKAGTGSVTAQTVVSSGEYTDAEQVSFSSTSYLNVGSPVIVAATGEYATILSLNGTLATLDHGLTIASGGLAYVVIETGGGSPVTSVCVTKTGLKP